MLLTAMGFQLGFEWVLMVLMAMAMGGFSLFLMCFYGIDRNVAMGLYGVVDGNGFLMCF